MRIITGEPLDVKVRHPPKFLLTQNSLSDIVPNQLDDWKTLFGNLHKR